MRDMYLDADRFAFLDEVRDKGMAGTVMPSVALVGEFPGLRPEEAGAVRVDWRAAYRERGARRSGS